MRNIKCFILLFILFLVSYIPAKALEVSVSSLIFFQGESYLELYTRVMGNSVQFVSTDTNLTQSSVELMVLIKSGAKIKMADKYNLQSPILKTSADYYDMRRFKLGEGSYSIELQYVDLNNISDTLTYTETITVTKPTKGGYCSDVLLMNDLSIEQGAYAFEKGGFSFEPLTYNLFDTKQNTFYFYTEFYQLDKTTEPLYCKYYIMNEETLMPQIKPAYKQLITEENFAFVESFDISHIESGNYVFIIEIVDKEKNVSFYKEERFAVYHPLTDYKSTYESDSEFRTSFVQLLDEGEVNYALKAIFPRVGNNKTGILNDVIWGNDLKVKRYFLYDYWSQYSLTNSKDVYDKYMEVARAIDLKFANNVGHGFETDRGYVFLKYGKPDDYIAVEDEPSAPPYEIWVYNHLKETNQTNVKFLFHNPSLVTNDFTLLHSTCRGEISNPRWELELYKDDNVSAPTDNRVDASQSGDGYHRNARRYFTDL